MNPTIPEEVVSHAYEQDAAAARAEYGAQFRSDVETFVSREAAAIRSTTHLAATMMSSTPRRVP